MRSPVGDVEHDIEPSGQEFIRIAPEIAPVILVHEPRGGDVGAGGELAHFGDLLVGERAIDGEEFVILVFAHDAIPASVDGQM